MPDEKSSEKYGFLLREEGVWMPVRTIPQNEQKVLKYLEGAGVPAYLPTVRKIRIQNVTRREKNYTYRREVYVPMFPSYVFACLAMTDREPLWNTHSVLKIMTLEKSYEPRFLEELHTVRMMEELSRNSKLEFVPELRPGDRFVIESGPWIGVYGRLEKKDRIASWSVSLDVMGACISAVIDPSKYKFRRIE